MATAESTSFVNERFTVLPTSGLGYEDALRVLEAQRVSDVDWKGGRAFSLAYYAGPAHSDFLGAAHKAYAGENGLNPGAFPSLLNMERDVVRMAATLFHGGPDAAGVMTSGGTESLMLAVLSARERHHKRKFRGRPEMIIPETAHVALEKAAHLFGVEVKKARMTRGLVADVKHVKSLLSRNTALVVASAPQYPHGHIDPVAEIAALADKRGIPCHVDACVGGFMLPFIEKLGRTVKPWDFRVPGVTSISADLHKYAYTSKGASVFLLRDGAALEHQMFVATDWPGGIYASPSLPGTRPGGPIAAAWASLVALGESGYLELTKKALAASDALRDGIRNTRGLKLLSPDDMTIVTWTTEEEGLDCYVVADLLSKRGWHIDRQQRPVSVHMTVMAQHAPIIEKYLSDLRDCVEQARSNPELRRQGEAPMYGMMAKLPLRGTIAKSVKKIMVDVYTGKKADLSASGSSGSPLVDKVLEKVGPTLQDALDRVEKVKETIRSRRG